MPPRKRRQKAVCVYYPKGTCMAGDECKFRHVSSGASTSTTPQTNNPAPPHQGSNPTTSTAPNASNSNKQSKRGEHPCFAWAKHGSCPKGDKCWFSHDVPTKPSSSQSRKAHAQSDAEARERANAIIREEARVQAERQARERELELEREREHALVAQERIRREEEARELQRVRQAQERAVREEEARERQRALEEQERARIAEEAQVAAAKTTQHVLLGSIVTFGAGLDIQAFTTGFESCIVHVRDLPASANEREIYALFTQQGIPKASLYLMFNRVLPNGTREVRMAMNAEAGHALSIGLDELEFRDRHLSFEVGTYNIPGAMGASHTKDANILTISWPSASSRYVVTYSDHNSADQMIRRLNESIHLGRRLKVEHDRMFPGRKIRVSPNSIKIEGLSPAVTDRDVTILAGSHPMTLRALPLRGAPIGTVALDVVKRLIALSGCPDTNVISMEHAEARGDELKGMVKVRIAFRSWDQAKQVHDYTETHKPFNSVPCYLNLPTPLSYLITIPDKQYEAQRAQWLHLQNSVGGKKQCQMTQIPVYGKPIVRFRVSGSDQKAVGALKLRVESLAKGEKVPGWHARFGQSSREALAFADRVRVESGAFVKGDFRQRQIRVYGTTETVAQARAIIEEELARLAELEFTTQVPRGSVRFFLAEGLPQLRELLGEDNMIHFNPATLVLRTSGGEEARHIVSRVLEHSARSRAALPNATQGNTCPTCFDEATAPVRLGCGHTYCSTCLRHFLNSAADSDKFPLLCMGDEARCNVPIAIPLIERFLPAPQLNTLFETTFRTYISKRASELKYCRTPDCEQIYRVAPEQGPRPTPVQCPACLSTVCPRCHEDGHAGMTCEESRVHNNADEQERLVDEWIASQRGQVKRCPRCRVPIEKNEGCNHMSCKCGAHVCWRCLGVFAADTIYDHMREAHGGIGGELGENPEELAEQEDLLRQVAEARRAAEAGRLAADRAQQDAQRRLAEAQAQARARANPAADVYNPWMAYFNRQEEERRVEEQRELAARIRRMEQERLRRQAEEAQRQQRLARFRAEQVRQQQQAEQQRGWCTIM